MMEVRWIFRLFLLILFFSFNVAQIQPNYIAYRTPFALVSTCQPTQYFDIALLQCADCPADAVQKTNNWTQCDCANSTFYYAVNQGGGSLVCQLCTGNLVRSSDGFGCVPNTAGACSSNTTNQVFTESDLGGTPYNSTSSNSQPRIGGSLCVGCAAGAAPEVISQRCSACASYTPFIQRPTGNISCCTTNQLISGVCLQNILNATSVTVTPNYFNRFSTPAQSTFFQQNLLAAFYLCRMNLDNSTAQSQSRTLLSNVTACHLLGNIAAMQFYYPVQNYAYYLYEQFIWQSTSQSIWTPSNPRPAIPFLAYPSSYYSEISSSSYNWIPASFSAHNIVRIKFAKYSATGQYLGLFDGFDSIIQLCGNGYTDGRPAFTFATVYNKTCLIRTSALWSSAQYETVFFDPYIVFSQSGSDRMLPIPVVIRNYQTATNTMPNQADDQSQWVYHRRFFLLDRISGVTGNELKNINYAQSIQILYRLVGGTSYIQPPVIVINYDEISAADLVTTTTVQVTFSTNYQMDLSNHIRDLWTAIGVLSGVGIILALFQSLVWYSRSGKEVIDLWTIGKVLLNLCNTIATMFFIVMVGVALWWLIFFKRDDTVFFVIPTSTQQASFTALVVVAFVLKTLDILQLIIRQSNIDIFFIDWEKPKSDDPDRVSIWRSYFVANEFNEIQTFRRINLSFQLIFLLFLLKVINLENVAAAQPNTNLFPTSADYQAPYNGILRVGIAFSMWLATALIQYLVYVLFYQRFVEDRLVNFMDFCSVSNISIFILMENHYGYYIHGRSPHGVTDVNMKDMLMHIERESNELIGRRGLEPNSDDQTFIVQISRTFRSQYDILLRNYQNRILNRMTKKDDDHESDILMASYRNLNEFLCAFIHRSLPMYNYVIRHRFLVEKLLNREFRKTPVADPSDSIFYIDPDRNFARVLFVGHENSLFIWNMATFLFVDYFAFNYILAAIITYLLHQIAVKLRTTLGARNLSKKTLIPQNFLI